jgi:hypothetical protein
MTKVGKIFVIIVLLMSMALCGLIILWYARSAPYAVMYQKAQDAIKVADASSFVSAQQLESSKTAQKAELDRLDLQIKKLRDDLDARDKLIGTLQTNLSDLKKEKIKQDELVKKAQTESLSRQNDVEQLRLTLKAEQEANVKLVRESDKLRQDRVKAEIDRDAYKDKNLQLMTQLEKVAQDLAKASIVGSRGATTSSKPNDPNPPAESMDGLVAQVDPSGLVKLTIGSDAGLHRDHTLEAYRLNAATQKYLGRVRILSVTPTEAVAQPLGKMTAPLQKGDIVASRILK